MIQKCLKKITLYRSNIKKKWERALIIVRTKKARTPFKKLLFIVLQYQTIFDWLKQ